MNCKGEENKDEIVELYDLKPFAHIKLLNGQKKDGCCGPLEDRYYAFEATPKQEGLKSEVFYCGDFCAKGLLKRIGHKELPLFNLLSQAGKIGTGGTNTSSGTEKVELCAVNQQLIEAIYLLCAVWDKPPSTGLVTIIDYTKRYSNRENARGVEWVNNTIKERGSGKTLSEIYNDFRANYSAKIRNFEFTDLRNCMDYVIKSKKLEELNYY